MKIKELKTIEELKEQFNLLNDGKIIEDNLEGRQIIDAKVLTTIAANANGNMFDIGTHFGSSALKLASNTIYNVYTVNMLPEQMAAGEKHVTDVLTMDEIGKKIWLYKEVKNIYQVYENTLIWTIPCWMKKNIKLVFIDANHDTRNVLNDSNKLWNVLAKDGYMLWHDFNPELRSRHNWIDSVMTGVEIFLKEKNMEDIYWVKDSWIGIIKK